MYSSSVKHDHLKDDRFHEHSPVCVGRVTDGVVRVNRGNDLRRFHPMPAAVKHKRTRRGQRVTLANTRGAVDDTAVCLL